MFFFFWRPVKKCTGGGSVNNQMSSELIRIAVGLRIRIGYKPKNKIEFAFSVIGCCNITQAGEILTRGGEGLSKEMAEISGRYPGKNLSPERYIYIFFFVSNYY